MSRVSLSGLAVLMLAGAGITPALAADKIAPPDFSLDAGTAWMEVGDELLSPPSGPGPIHNDPRYPFINNGQAARLHIQPTFRVADLTNPILQPWAREQMRKANDDVLAGKVPFRAHERCYPAGVPGFVVYTLIEPFYFLQTLQEVTIVNQSGPEVRRIFLNVPHSKTPKPSWYGESVGHYEGDTLVADTVGITTKAFIDSHRTPHTEKLHVVERFRMTEGGKTLEDAMTVDDPGAFTTPWSAVQRWHRQDGRPMEEMICAENNYAYFDYDVVPLPQAKTPDF